MNHEDLSWAITDAVGKTLASIARSLRVLAELELAKACKNRGDYGLEKEEWRELARMLRNPNEKIGDPGIDEYCKTAEREGE